ncbi:MAG TPA: PAS domain S-box protein [Verrucomicrobiae bacterium]|nr:PAS domain S-box protein [Verrucomicrobiae bacterium]
MGRSRSRINFSRQGDAPGAAHDPAAPIDFIRESERLFRAIGGSAPAIVWMDDTEGRCIYLNRAWCDFTGLSEADGLGEGWSSAVHPEDRATFRSGFLTAVANREPYRSEYRLRRHDGEWRWVIDTATPIYGADGAYQGHLGSVIDITDRKRMEAALSENEEMLRLAVEATELGLWDYDIASGALVWNRRLKELYGMAPDAEITYEVYKQAIHPEDREQTVGAYQAALDPAGAGRFGFEHRTVSPLDGRVRWVQAAGRVIFAGGKPSRVIGTVRDVTERRTAEAALRASEARYRQIVEVSLQGIWAHRDGRIIFANAQAARMFGAASAEDLIGKPVLDLAHPDERPRAAERMKLLTEKRESVPLTEMRFLGAEGRTIVLEVQAVPFEDGGEPAILAVGRDVTERKSTEERQAFLMAELDHRVRNSLASIQSMALLTGRTAATKEEYAEKLQGRIAAMARAHGLLTREQWDGADLADVVRDALQAFGEAVLIDGRPDCPLRARDALNLALVLHELATNAAKYGALSVPGGKVDVRWDIAGTGDERRVHLLWQERGGPPVQAPSRQGFGTRLIHGTLPKVELKYEPAGLRCAIRLKLRSRGQGRKPEGLATNPAGVKVAAGELPLRGRRILLVEDDPLSVLQIQSALENAGAEIAAVASTLQEALDAAEDGLSAAVLDVNLDGEMSHTAAERLIARRVPIVFATGYDAASLLPTHLRAVPTLQKPVDTAVLVQMLAGLTAPHS